MRKSGLGSLLVICVSALLFFFSNMGLGEAMAGELSVIPAAKFITEWKSIGDVVGYKKDGNILTVNLKQEKSLRIYILSPSIIRVRFNKDGEYKVDNSYAVVKSDFGNVNYQVEDKKDKLVLKTSEVRVELTKKPCRISFYRGNVLLNTDAKQGITWNDNRIVNYKKIAAGSKFYGFGEKTGPFVKNGTSMTMWNTDTYKYDKKTDPSYMTIPFFIEANKEYSYGILFDNTYQSYFNMGQQNKASYYFGALDGEMNYYFINGKDVKDVIYKYTQLTGRINMPPKWALGYQQSRFSYYPETRVKEIAQTLRDKKLPCDVIYLDINFMDGFKSFTWSKEDFPDVPGMLNTLHTQGFKAITIIDPGIKAEDGYHVYDSGVDGGHFVQLPTGDFAEGSVWPGTCVFPDFTNPETRQWWGSLYKKLTDVGMDGFWNDMNEPSVFNTTYKTLPLDGIHHDFGLDSPHAKIHNVYGLEMIRATLEGLDKIRPENRNFVLSRSGYAGLQRYAAVWTGDNTANWEHLKLNITMTLNLGLSGIPLVGADVGGYTDTPSPELFVRWMQLGVFTPLYRNHTEKDTADQEPWAFGENAENISRKYLELRYKLIQHMYDFVYESYKTGVPVDRPLFMEFPTDDKTYTIDDEFMFGNTMLIAPVIDEGATSRKVYLPKGIDWYGYWDGKKYSGGNTYTVSAPLDVMPIFVRSGAIVPMREVVQYVGEKEVNPITFLVYPGSNYTYTLYLDDEKTMGYKKGEYRETKIANIAAGNSRKLKFEVVKNGFTPKEEYFFVKFISNSKPSTVKIGSSQLTAVGDSNSLATAAVDSYYYDAQEKAVVVKVFDSGKNFELQLN